jgi:DNA-binding ferritin-like protein
MKKTNGGFSRKSRAKRPTNKHAKTSKRKFNLYKGGKSKENHNSRNSRIVHFFLQMLNMVKLYHWKTRSYSQHKATDELYERLNNGVDEFVEVLLGKDETRVSLMEKRIDLIDPDNTKDFKKCIYDYRQFLTDFNIHFDAKKDSDLLSLRDQILANINQFLYLMTFDK